MSAVAAQPDLSPGQRGGSCTLREPDAQFQVQLSLRGRLVIGGSLPSPEEADMTDETRPHALNTKVLTTIRHAMQDALHAAGHSRPAMGHLAEAVAAGFGRGSHASLLALVKEWGGDISAPPFDRDACGRRLSELGLSDPAAVCATIAAHDAAPQPPPARPLPSIQWEHDGRMISVSKSGYHSRFPHNLVVFNACVCTRSSRQTWHGDLDVTRDLEQLQARAREFGEDLYVLWEGDGRRFVDGSGGPEFDFSRAAAIVAPDGLLTIWRDMMAASSKP
jgi:hypothetical protein